MRASSDGGLSSLRLAVCGAERVREETRKIAKERFDFEVLEGYGVTECAPVLAANQPGDIRSGTIGKMLPGIESRIEAVEGLENAGRLWVRGPNIMKGYISANDPGTLVPIKDGWHDTGDVVSVDEEGYYERIVLVTDNPKPKRADLAKWAKANGIPEIAVPKKIISVESVPVLGTGKLDYVSITKIAKEAA